VALEATIRQRFPEVSRVFIEIQAARASGAPLQEDGPEPA
jgi:hypothetical protein